MEKSVRNKGVVIGPWIGAGAICPNAIEIIGRALRVGAGIPRLGGDIAEMPTLGPPTGSAAPASADLIPSALRPDRAWIATRYSVFATAYNTSMVAVADVPRRYEDLLDAKWKGRLGIEAVDREWNTTPCLRRAFGRASRNVARVGALHTGAGRGP